MKKFLPLLVCLSLSLFAVARATKPAHTPGPDTMFNDANKAVAAVIKAERDDDDSMEVTSSDEGEDMNDDDGGDAPGDEDTGDDDAGDDDGGGDGGGEEGG